MQKAAAKPKKTKEPKEPKEEEKKEEVPAENGETKADEEVTLRISPLNYLRSNVKNGLCD